MVNPLLRILLIVTIALSSSNAVAEIYKCTNTGKTTYQSEPCQATLKEKNTSAAFDGWVFGETISDVKRSARNRQLPMSPGTSSYISAYNEKVLNRNPNERRYTYKTKMLGKLTSVTLFFTKLSQQLFKIEATFHVIQLKPEERKYFYESLYSQLSDKYGKAENVSISQNRKSGSILGSISDLLTRNITEGLIGSNLVWSMNTDSQVSLSYKKNYHTMSSYKLAYENDTFASQNENEVSREVQDRTDHVILQDSNRL